MRPGSRFVYYGYSGMVLMFYVYYYLYSGGWDYYFSGTWTHEENPQLNQLLSPGFFINGQAYNIPKIIAAPFAMIATILLAYGFWSGVELLYARIARRVRPGISQETIRHQMLRICAWATFNTFYLFAGRPNIALMPTWLQTVVNTTIVAASTIWLMMNISRRPEDHAEESLAAALRSRVKQSYDSVKDFVRGKPVDNLDAREVNILAKLAKGD